LTNPTHIISYPCECSCDKTVSGGNLVVICSEYLLWREAGDPCLTDMNCGVFLRGSQLLKLIPSGRFGLSLCLLARQPHSTFVSCQKSCENPPYYSNHIGYWFHFSERSSLYVMLCTKSYMLHKKKN
jgi:hypothetical protein